MKIQVPAAVVLASSLLLAGCAGEAADDGRPSVVASFYPLQFVAERVGGEMVDVSTLTQAGGEPHDLELSPQQVAEVQDADVVVYQQDFQASVDDAVEQADRAAATTVDAADGVELLDADEEAEHDHGEEGHDHGDEDHDHAHDHADEGHDHSGEGHDHSDEGHDHAHDHGGVDPHIWLDPANLVPAAEATAEALAEADPDNADAYRSNAADLIDELETLGDDISTSLQSCEVRDIVTSHAAFAYLTEPNDLEQISIAGLNPGTEPSAARLAEISDLVESEGITTVFTETLVSPAVARTIAREAGVETAVLDPLEGLTDETQDEDYFSIMRSNLEAIQKANSCS